MKKLLLAAAFAVACAGAQAQYHFEITAGAAQGQVDCSRIEVKCVKDNLGSKILFGADLSQNIAIEGSFVDFGRYKASAAASVNSGMDAEVADSVKAFAAEMAFRAEILPSLTGIARIGLAAVHSHVSGSTFDYVYEKTKLAPIGGLAISVATPLGANVELAYDRTQGSFSGNNTAVSLISIGAVLNF